MKSTELASCLDSAAGRVVLYLGPKRHAVVMQPIPDDPWLVVGVFHRGELVRVVEEPAEVRRIIARGLARGARRPRNARSGPIGAPV